jgi:class 3 adenylate cyclase
MMPAEYAALHALADRMDADRRGFEHYARLWRKHGDTVLEATAAGRVRQLADCARDLRNTLNDLMKETT